MTTPDLTQTVEAPAVVRDPVVHVPVTFWLMWSQVDQIAKPLIDGSPVEICGKQSWCYGATRANASLIVSALHDEYALRARVEIDRRDGFYFLLFTCDAVTLEVQS